MQPQPQMINIDGVEYDYSSLPAEIQGTIALMNFAQQQVQAAQMELASRSAAQTQVGAQLREMLSGLPSQETRAVRKALSTAPSRKTPAKTHAKKR